MIFRSLDTEIDQVAGMRDDRAELFPQGMCGEGLGLRIGQRLGEPLHVILHEDLHRRAADSDRAVDGRGHAADGRHMRSEQGE